MKNHYYIEETLMRSKSQAWQIEEFGFPVDGLGDILGRSATAALVYNKPEMLQKCVDVYKEGKRWPDELGTSKTNPNIARNWLQFRLSKWLYKLGLRKTRLYRPQRSLTRDPAVGIIVALWLMPNEKIGIYAHWKEQIQDIKIRWWQNKPDLYHWKKYLETGKPKHKRKYEWWALFNLRFKQPMFVLYHMAYMAYCADSWKMKAVLRKHIPRWNCLLMSLTYEDIHKPWWFLQKAKTYRAKNEYQWSSNKWHVPPEPGNENHYYLDEDDEFKLDKDELNYILNR